MRARAVFLLLSGVLASCFSPQAIVASGEPGLDISGYPDGTAIVEIPVAPGELLRGVFVPAGDGAPIVVQFLARLDAVTLDSDGGRSPTSVAGLARRLRDLGLALFVVDYRGVGASDGAPGSSHLREDVVAVWRAALDLAGGDPSRLVLRGCSVGTVAAALVLAEGAEPAATVMVSPVQPRTAAPNYLRAAWGPVLGCLSAPLIRGIADVDLRSVLADARSPTLVITSEVDVFLPTDEQGQLARVLSPEWGRWIRVETDPVDASATERVPGWLDHYRMVKLFSRLLHPEETELYLRRFPGAAPLGARVDAALAAVPPGDRAPFASDSAARRALLRAARRLDPPHPAMLPVIARAAPTDRDLWRYGVWLHTLPLERLQRLPADAARALVDFEDPLGPLPLETLVTLSVAWRDDIGWPLRDLIGFWWMLEPRAVSAPVELGETDPMGLAQVAASAQWRMREFEPQLGEAARRRRFLRLLLKLGGHPDRVRRLDDGRHAVEVWDDGVWSVIDPDTGFRTAALRPPVGAANDQHDDAE